MTVTDTSKEAYRDVVTNGKASSERKLIMDTLKQFKSLTSAEVASIVNISRHNAASRLCDLAGDGLVIKADKRPCDVCERTCYTWELVEVAL